MALFASGCQKGKPPTATSATKSAAEPPLVPGVVSNSPGESQEYVDGPPRRLVYDVRWKSGTLNASDSEHFDLTLRGVSGEFYKDARPVASFEADTGTATHSTGTLTLNGNVHIRSIDPKSKIKGATMTCDAVTYRTGDEIIRAKGDIVLDGPAMHATGIDELWCSNDFGEIATPDLFVPVRHNLPTPAIHK